MIIARFYFGLLRRQVKTYLEPVYGTGPDVIAKVARDNPADLLSSTDLRPGELAIYVNYPGRDNYNFDAQDESFAWLAARRGVAVDLTQGPRGRHNLSLHRGRRAARLPVARTPHASAHFTLKPGLLGRAGNERPNSNDDFVVNSLCHL